jgi:hypothetical protein
VGLSRNEQRRIEEMEAALSAEDPAKHLAASAAATRQIATLQVRRAGELLDAVRLVLNAAKAVPEYDIVPTTGGQRHERRRDEQPIRGAAGSQDR